MIEFKLFKIHQERPQFSTEEGWKFAPLHWVCAVKQDGRHKAGLVIGGHVTDAEGYNTFSSKVRMEHVRLQVFLAAYFDNDMLSGDIGSAYLNAQNKGKNLYQTRRRIRHERRPYIYSTKGIIWPKI